MSGNIWILLGVLATAFAAIAIPHGFNLRSDESKDKTIAEIREISKQKAQPNQIAVFQQINNNFVFQETKSEKTHVVTPASANSKRGKNNFLSPQL